MGDTIFRDPVQKLASPDALRDIALSVLALTRYGRAGASSRIRFEQFAPSLRDAGIDVQFAPFLPDTYVQALQAGTRSRKDAIGAYVRRIAAIVKSRAHDVLWIEKELLPWMPGWVELPLLSKSIPVVLDYDDAVFHTYDTHPSAAVRNLLGRKHAALMRNATLVVCGNDYLAQYARKAGASRVVIIPTVVDAERYAIESPTRSGSRTVVGWIGQRSTAEFLRHLVPLFQDLNSSRGLEFRAIGVDAEALGLQPIKGIPWSEATEAADIHRFDIGIMPLPDEPFERGKCGYKLIQYMACGLPVIASPVGVNRSIVDHGVTGFLAESPREWKEALIRLGEDALLRARMGAAGRAKALGHYSIQSQAGRLADLLKSSVRISGRT